MMLFPLSGFVLGNSLNAKKPLDGAFKTLCGEWGIRTRGPLTVNSFQDCRNRPLCQLSATKVQTPLESANSDMLFFDKSL
jgi:hypothetical protein